MFIESGTQRPESSGGAKWLVIGGTLRPSGVETVLLGFCVYKHFVPLGLKPKRTDP
jgi:hypothetical protein